MATRGPPKRAPAPGRTRILLAQLAPRPGDLSENLATLAATVRRSKADLYVFPELFLSGYRVGDAMHHLAIGPTDPLRARLGAVARRARATVVVGAPAQGDRPGEIVNAAFVALPDGTVTVRGKRFLPTFGPFEEGSAFSPARAAEPIDVGGLRLGTLICYDAFFPEVARDLSLRGADLLVIPSAAPVTSRRLFDRVLPARAIENAVPLVYVNRVGVEDGIVFGGGSQALDARGEPIAAAGTPADPARSDEAVWTVDLDRTEAARWRPFRPVLRDVAGLAAAGGPSPPDPAPPVAGRSPRL